MQPPVDQPGFAAKRERLLALLRSHAFQEREVVLSSGRTSNFYIDCKQVSLDPEGAALIGELFHATIEAIAPSAVAVGGLTLGADPLATATSVVSFQQGRPRAAFIVRKEPKGHGTNKLVDGQFKDGADVIVLEDVTTTGGSSLKAVNAVRERGAKVRKVVTIVDRLEGAEATFAKDGIELVALFDRNDFLDR